MVWRTEREYCGKPQCFGCEFLGDRNSSRSKFIEVGPNPSYLPTKAASHSFSAIANLLPASAEGINSFGLNPCDAARPRQHGIAMNCNSWDCANRSARGM